MGSSLAIGFYAISPSNFGISCLLGFALKVRFTGLLLGSIEPWIIAEPAILAARLD
jgi:hypothetical protein